MRHLASGYDAELERHGRALRRAWGVRAGDRVLDVGCGAGRTTRDAARAAGTGEALGVDVASAAVERARALAEGLPNVAFECADAQVHPFPGAYFDVAVSRFGTMFFADPAAAFANIGRALRPGGRLVMMVWQAAEANAWDVAVRRALATSPGTGPDPFSLADPAAVERLLAGAGFTGTAFADVREPVYYGPDVDAALAWVRGFVSTREALERMGPADAERALGRLRATLAAHLGEDGVLFDSRAWIVTARRP
ncbi:class I SAM-dependent methyltransferase [Actinomadura parmotrematis]|uniref:Methyltransferase domain-containing protein n=1 Tax=Actinomadura parmotrematis TaxID=2864039 RepID=A0ABS7FVM4_9ACTN|nr:class I SAM-dependent methyltransferase [Actinomadura parmotrematis]MBW8484331.1 methyltransferase domain-containing protein [Actinomadura parmotrematis]